MRRALVLTTESAGHSFRASLPSHVFEPIAEEPECDPTFEPEVIAAREAAGEAVTAENWWRLTRTDVRGFASVYLATFMAVLVFIL
ncbi:MAG: hypothetical protein ABJP34_11080 [Erythrobacter sp.]